MYSYTLILHGMEKVVHIVGLNEKKTDFIYWQSQPPWKRLAALEEIRKEYNTWKYVTEQGFQRVYSVVKRV